ncbi:50S ribosomal protein L11 methyltransferase [Sphingomonas quercus]|uniref:Ribosomal protein L11 methyltransferase n=1 Tax=Sphingomonas quercus TaxID=2842451 RepID=A0ABS6BNE7_9SPHN|nr:50S ribosomal protein L11 methyltransferase [Sphingomonas quercus]MBU3079177.1 50S ribosomal protein L11 methyltransferase [Sphingomonas quercus]
MSAEQCWKVTLPCTKAEGEAIAGDIGALAQLDEPPVLMTSEPDPTRPDDWRLDAYFETKPDKASLAMLRALVPSAAGRTLAVETVPQQDWLILSQAGLEPIRAGRFFVHTAAHADEVPEDAVAFQIEAGRAFGTGQHETTTGCLMMLDRMRRQGARFADVLDLGTGTGLLAFAALNLWPRARAIASDIDPVSIEVTLENAQANGVALGGGRGELGLVVADGMNDALLKAAAPYDLIIANILAGPLIEMAPAIADALAPGGTLILAGLLDHQAEPVARAYRRQRLRLADRIDRGDWPTLRLRKRQMW